MRFRDKAQQKAQHWGETRAGQGYSCPAFLLLGLRFECVPDDLTGPPDAFLICVGVHSERYRRVAMAQAFTDGHHVRAVGDRKGGACVAELVWAKILYAVSLAEFLKIAGGALGVHNVRAVVLGEHIPADSFPGLFKAELLQELQHVRPHVYSPGLAVFGAGDIDPSGGGVLSIAPDRECALCPVNIRPFQGASLTAPDAAISDKVYICLPFQGFVLQTLEDIGKLLDGIGFV